MKTGEVSDGTTSSGKRALIRITPDGGTAFDASGVCAYF